MVVRRNVLCCINGTSFIINDQIPGGMFKPLCDEAIQFVPNGCNKEFHSNLPDLCLRLK